MTEPTPPLDDVEAFLCRFVAFPSESAAIATALWAAHTHLLDCFESTPRLAFLSPEPGSGKTRALEILATLVPSPMLAVNATTPALFRAVADTRPTILFDEIDTIFGPKAKDNEELRGMLNAGHRRSGVSYRCVGDGSEQRVVAFPSYAALALAGLGELPDTILTRSVVVRMRKRAPHEHVEPYRERIHEPEGHQLREALSQWANATSTTLADTFPDMPGGVQDRPADVWEPLLMVADAAGGPWPERARSACVELVAANRDPATVSLGVRLLGDLRTIFRGETKLPTSTILERLHALEQAPWADLGGNKPFDDRALARMLGKYTTAEGTAIKSRTLRMPDGSTPKGYHAADLADAWSRYLPTEDTATVEHSAPTPPSMASHGRDGVAATVASVADVAPLSATPHTSRDQERSRGVADVADVADLSEAGRATTEPIESGPCSWCGNTFTRYQASTHPDRCTPCAVQTRVAS
ncbi:DUF3631 domain-containing protein [Halostreptopolyspora alba]|uniref:DUF3631 domain-containing protein n=1 Tax=Halostreptopolyspora alba TaxID=2487137 RepID=A0A3N0E5Q1_9ACTN|nr:DUF3631 domain-containing protein [Nocardiopsaceae bacterium YIM 96095]